MGAFAFVFGLWLCIGTGSLMTNNVTQPYTYTCAASAPLISSNRIKEVIGSDLIIYPIPATDRVVVNLEGVSPEGTIHITHVSGTSVLTQRVAGYKVELAVGHLPVGMYLLTWKPDRDRAVSRMLSIQR